MSSLISYLYNTRHKHNHYKVNKTNIYRYNNV